MRLTTALALAALAPILVAETPAAKPNLADRLQQYYRPAKGGSAAADAGHGRIVTVQRAGIVSVPNSDNDLAYLDVCPTVYRAGEIRQSAGVFCTEFLKKADKSLGVSEKAFVTGVQLNQTADKITLRLATCEPCKANQTLLRSNVVFEFPKGYLSRADADETIRAIDSVLTAEPQPDPPAPKVGPTTPPAESAPAPQVPIAAPPAAAAAPVSGTPTLKKGQTIEDVQRLLGSPQVIVDLGAKLVYTYPNAASQEWRCVKRSFNRK